MTPRIHIYQKFTVYINRYRVFNDNSGVPGTLYCFAEQKRAKLKERIYFYDTEEKINILFTFRADKVMDVHGKFYVEDGDGALIGYFQKDFGSSLLNSTWYLYDAADVKLLSITESNMVLALMRRYIAWVPFIGDIIDIFLILIKYHFIFYQDNPNAIVGKHRRISIWRDRYILFANQKAYSQIDKRLWAALGVALDALQAS